MAPTLYYDFNSPYAYLAFSRAAPVLGEQPELAPVALAFVLRAHKRLPWSLQEGKREPGVAECEARARQYGLAELRWPPGWPVDSYTLLSLRAALAAGEQGRLAEFSAAAFHRNFVEGLGLTHAEDIRAVCGRSGVDASIVLERVGSPEIKTQLAQHTEAAIAAGLYGVPTVAVGAQLFWGDDQLPAAAAALAA